MAAKHKMSTKSQSGRITGEVIAKETTQNEVLKFATEFEQKKAVG